MTTTSELVTLDDGGAVQVERFVTHMWLDPIALASHLQDDDPTAEPMVLRRIIRNIELPVARSWDHQEIIVPSYCGTNMVWITPSRDAVSGRLWWMSLPLATDPTSSDRVRLPRTLITETYIAEVDALDLCEEMGIVALVPRMSVDHKGPRYIRLMYV